MPSVSKQKTKALFGGETEISSWEGSKQIFLVSWIKAEKPGWVWLDMHIAYTLPQAKGPFQAHYFAFLTF